MHGVEAERQDALLYLATRMGKADEVFTYLSVEDFDPGFRQRLAGIVLALMEHQATVDPMTVMAECRKVSSEFVTYFTTLAEPLTLSASALIDLVRRDSQRRAVAAALTRATQMIEQPESDVDAVVELLTRDIERDGTSAVVERPRTFEEIMSIEDSARPWVIPDTLREGEVLLLTGEEGSGKSLFLSQIGLGASVGMNTMNLRDTSHDPVRVFVLDVENEDIQIRDNMRRLWPVFTEVNGGPLPSPRIEFSALKYAEMTNMRDRRRIVSEVLDAQPQLMIVGTVYKLAPVTDHEEAFNAIMRTVREIQRKTNAAVVIEHHAGNATDANKQRDYRAYGSSMWRRWPNFGMALVRQKDDRKVAELVRWRGDRARDRLWPAGLREGGLFPWTPIAVDEWEALYS